MNAGEHRFIITGLPRCRSAWLAAFLTDGSVFCHHELIRDCATAAEFPERFGAGPGEIKGDADTILPMFYPEIREALRDCRFAFVWRDVDQILDSGAKQLAECGLPDFPRDKIIPRPLMDGLLMMRDDHREAPQWKYEQLEDEGAVRDLHSYCTAQPWNQDRFRLFHPLRVTAIEDKVLSSQQLLRQWYPNTEAMIEAVRRAG